MLRRRPPLHHAPHAELQGSKHHVKRDCVGPQDDRTQRYLVVQFGEIAEIQARRDIQQNQIRLLTSQRVTALRYPGRHDRSKTVSHQYVFKSAIQHGLIADYQNPGHENKSSGRIKRLNPSRLRARTEHTRYIYENAASNGGLFVSLV